MNLSPKFLFMLSLLVACGNPFSSNDDNNDSGTNAPTKHAVAVIDSGFDIDNAVFEGKLVNAYDVRCQEMKHPFELLSGATRYKDLKENFLTYLDIRKGCTIDKKINNEISAEFAQITGNFNDWNSAVRDGTLHTLDFKAKVDQILSGEGGKYNYHGTATAGLIADQNDSVDLFIVSLNLKRIIMFNDVINGIACRSQAQIDLKTKLFQDEDVRAAFINADRELYLIHI